MIVTKFSRIRYLIVYSALVAAGCNAFEAKPVSDADGCYELNDTPEIDLILRNGAVFDGAGRVTGARYVLRMRGNVSEIAFTPSIRIEQTVNGSKIHVGEDGQTTVEIVNRGEIATTMYLPGNEERVYSVKASDEFCNDYRRELELR